MKLYTILFILFYALHTNAQNLVPKDKQGKWGYVKSGTNKFEIKPTYEQVLPFGEITDDDKALVKQKSKWGVIDTKGNILAKPIYDTVYIIQKEIAKCAPPDKSLTINIRGTARTPTIQHDLSQHLKLNWDYIVFSENQQLGLLAKKGNTYQEILLPQYSTIEFAIAEYDIFILSTQEGKKFLFNAKSNTISKPIEKYEVYTKRQRFHSMCEYGIVFTQNELKGLMNPDLKIIVEPQYNKIDFFKNKVHLKTYKKHKIGIIDTSGKVILPFEFDKIEKQENYFIAQKDSFWGIYNMQGIQIASHLYQDIVFKERQNSFLVQKDNLWGFLDTKGQEIMPCGQENFEILTEEWIDEGVCIPMMDFDKVLNSRLHKGYEYEENDVIKIKAYVKTIKNGKQMLWVLDDGKAYKLVSTEYDYISLLEEEKHAKSRNIGLPRLFVLSIGKDKKTIQRGVMNDRGRMLIPIKYRNYYMPNKQLIIAENKDKAGVFDTQGTQLLPVEYDTIKFNNTNQQELYLQKGKKNYIWNIQTQKMTEITESEHEKK